MAFAIQNAAVGACIAGDTWDGLPANRLTLADQNIGNPSSVVRKYTSAVQAFAAPVRCVRAFIFCKNYVLGSATSGPTYTLEVADNSAFTTNPRAVAVGQGPQETHSLYINGVVPDNLSAQWTRLVVTFGTGGNSPGVSTDNLTFDVNFDAT